VHQSQSVSYQQVMKQITKNDCDIDLTIDN